MALAQSRKQGATVYAVRVGPKAAGKTRYVVGFAYPPKPVTWAIGSAVTHEDLPGVVVAPQAIALLGRGPRVYGWPNNEPGLAAARDTVKRIPGAVVVRVRDWRGGPQ